RPVWAWRTQARPQARPRADTIHGSSFHPRESDPAVRQLIHAMHGASLPPGVIHHVGTRRAQRGDEDLIRVEVDGVHAVAEVRETADRHLADRIGTLIDEPGHHFVIERRLAPVALHRAR